MASNVGAGNIYEDGDQRNIPQSEIEQQKKDNRFHEGKQNSHKANDSSKQILPDKERFLADCCKEDERTIANRLAREEKVHFNKTAEDLC